MKTTTTVYFIEKPYGHPLKLGNAEATKRKDGWRVPSRPMAIGGRSIAAENEVHATPLAAIAAYADRIDRDITRLEQQISKLREDKRQLEGITA